MIRHRAAKALRILGQTGVTINEFAGQTGLSINSLYTYTSRPERMSETKAEYIYCGRQKDIIPLNTVLLKSAKPP